MRPFAVAILLCAVCSPVRGQVTPAPLPPAAQDDESGAHRGVSPASLAGRWTSAPFELALTSDFHRSVYGGGARSVRSVAMTIKPSGEGVFTVTNSVRDGRGREVAGTRQIEELRFAVGELSEEPGRQPHYTTRVEHAERRFADDPRSAFALNGAKLALYVSEGKPTSVEVRFDTPEGTGSFWETLRRPRSRSVAK
jgi:hypothetical protein